LLIEHRSPNVPASPPPQQEIPWKEHHTNQDPHLIAIETSWDPPKVPGSIHVKNGSIDEPREGPWKRLIQKDLCTVAEQECLIDVQQRKPIPWIVKIHLHSGIGARFLPASKYSVTRVPSFEVELFQQ
jgi:hypothetical protein